MCCVSGKILLLVVLTVVLKIIVAVVIIAIIRNVGYCPMHIARFSGAVQAFMLLLRLFLREAKCLPGKHMGFRVTESMYLFGKYWART